MKSNLHVATIVFEVGICLPITIPWYCVAPTIRLLYSPPHLTVVTKHLTVVTNTPYCASSVARLAGKASELALGCTCGWLPGKLQYHIRGFYPINLHVIVPISGSVLMPRNSLPLNTVWNFVSLSFAHTSNIIPYYELKSKYL